MFEINIFEICCGSIIPGFIAIAIAILLYLRKKGVFMRLKLISLTENNDAVAVISRLFAIGIPMTILIIIHVCNAFGVEMWGPSVAVYTTLYSPGGYPSL